MKKALLILLLTVQMNAQEKIYETSDVQTQPEFPGGTKAFHGNVNSYFFMKLDGYNRNNNGVDFVVEKDGTVSSLTVIGNSAPITQSDLPGFQKTCPKWKPATVNGKAVRCHIRYELRGISDLETIRSGNYDVPPTVVPNQPKPDNTSIFNMTAVGKKPTFPGGMDKFNTYIENNFKLPEGENLNGKIWVTFVVEKDGSLTDITVLRDLGLGSGKEAIRVLKLSPKWIPGEHNGNKVRVQYAMPIILKS